MNAQSSPRQPPRTGTLNIVVGLCFLTLVLEGL